MTKGTYVDGFVFVVPKNKVAAYKKMAKEGARAWMKHGALDYKECMGDHLDPDTGGVPMLGFPKMTNLKSTETVWFSYIVYKNKKHRDAVNKKVMAQMEKDYANAKDFVMPFDMKRMAIAGFKVVVSG